ncbi:MAG: glycoside hydrolase family 88 protein [Terrimicrobiaceae bacterium]|nr:glycoside hydrolase family 88 protein [Terrimicrobiaceae bacterium]
MSTTTQRKNSRQTAKKTVHTADLLRLIASRTAPYDMTVWFWGDAIACDGLLEAAELGDFQPARRQVEQAFGNWMGKQLGWVDYLTPGGALLHLHRLTENTALLEAARHLATHLVEKFPKARGGVHLFRPDLPAHRHSVWIDSLYHVPTLFAALSRKTGDPAYAAIAVEVLRTHLRVLQSKRGPLLAHSYDVAAEMLKGYGWGRGQGWALLGMVDTLSHLDSETPGYAETAGKFLALCEATLVLQDASGFWRTLMHDREAYLESSTAAFLGAAYTKGCRLGLLPGKYAVSAELAWRAMLSRVDERGGLSGVSSVTWSWVSNLEETTMYKSLPTEMNLWGQGAALRFCAERIRSGLSSPALVKPLPA